METPPVAPQPPIDPPTHQATRGLGRLFVAAVLLTTTLIAQVILHMIPLDLQWYLIPAGLWLPSILLGLIGRVNCRKAMASRRSKWILRLSLGFSLLGLIVQLIYVAGLTTLVLGQWNLESFRLAPFWKKQLPYLLGYVGPAFDFASSIFFLLYLRGLAQALEFPGFANDSIAVIVVGLVSYVLAPALMGVVWYLLIEPMVPILAGWGGTNADEIRRFAWPFVLGVVLVIFMWPFVSYCTLVTQLRDSILTRLKDQEEEKKRPKWMR